MLLLLLKSNSMPCCFSGNAWKREYDFFFKCSYRPLNPRLWCENNRKETKMPEICCILWGKIVYCIAYDQIECCLALICNIREFNVPNKKRKTIKYFYVFWIENSQRLPKWTERAFMNWLVRCSVWNRKQRHICLNIESHCNHDKHWHKCKPAFMSAHLGNNSISN